MPKITQSQTSDEIRGTELSKLFLRGCRMTDQVSQEHRGYGGVRLELTRVPRRSLCGRQTHLFIQPHTPGPFKHGSDLCRGLWSMRGSSQSGGWRHSALSQWWPRVWSQLLSPLIMPTSPHFSISQGWVSARKEYLSTSLA